MKSSPSTATVLILIMLLMVVAAGFVFLFQAELRFRDNLRQLSADNETLRSAQANLELELSGAVATRDAVSADLAAAEGDTRLLEGQLVESQQAVDELTVQVATRTADVDGLTADLATLEGEQQSLPPVARIVTPVEAATLPIATPVEIVLVASDAAGLASLTLDVNGRRYTTYTLDGERLYARTVDWPAPVDEGEVVFTVTAVNLNNVRSEPHSVVVNLADTEARNATIRAEVEANVSELRGLEPLEPVVPVVLSRDQLRERIERESAAETTPDESRADVLELSAFDFLGRDYDLYTAQVTLQSEGILGYYDPATTEFVVVNDGALLDPAAQWTHAHEFVHALQDQYYDLNALSDESLDSEARAAVRALAEGEAELVQYLYLFENDYFTDAEEEAILNDSEQADSDFLSEFPPVLINDLAFPYTDGVEFVIDLYRENGFAAIDAAWADPPRSTEQILHPDRYRAGDAPQVVTLPPLGDTLGAGWMLLDEDILGEFYLRQYLAQQLSGTVVNRVATGWGGDQYAVYWNEATDEMVMALRLVWDTPEDALEFAEVYPDYPAALFKTTAESQPDGSACWTGDDVICFRQLEGESLIVRAPDVPIALFVLQVIQS
ncbi:MAG: hypothetical protein KA586_00430 [Candidatus Promineofilum sp.]|nr:hypothetical protein [Promineifilum sp.]